MKSFVVLVLLTVVSCVLCNPRENVIPKFFRNIGQFKYSDREGIRHIKTYYVSRELRLNWANSFMFCRSFGMDLVELTTEVESNKFLKLFGDHTKTLETWYHIGGSYMGAAKNDFYWMTTGKQITYPLKFQPGLPDNYLGKEKCLSIFNRPGSFTLNDVDCYDTWIWNFVCQKIESVSQIDPKSSFVRHRH